MSRHPDPERPVEWTFRNLDVPPSDYALETLASLLIDLAEDGYGESTDLTPVEGYVAHERPGSA